MSDKIPIYDVIPKDEVEERQDEVFDILPVHYIGLRYYTLESFKEEAHAIGVSRAFSLRIAKKFRWGERIYLAIYTKEQTEDGKEIPAPTVFGYFVIGWVNFKGTPRLSEAVLKDPRIRALHQVKFPEPVHVDRGCGDYEVAGYVVVDDSMELSTLLGIVHEHAKRLGVKAKVLLGGEFYEIPPFKLRGLKFSQNIVYAYLTKEAAEHVYKHIIHTRKTPKMPHAEVEGHGIQIIRKYKLNRNYLRREKE